MIFKLWSIIKRLMGFDPTKASFTSSLPTDQTMVSFSFQFVCAPGGGTISGSISLNGSNTGSCLWVGRFSLDQVSWTSFDGVISAGSGEVRCSGFTSPPGFFYSAANTTGGTQEVYVQITLIARTDQQPFIAPTSITDFDFPGLATNLEINNNGAYPLFDSRINYMKIADKGILPFTVPHDGTFATLTIPHNLGYVPFALIQMEFEPPSSSDGMWNLSNVSDVVGLLKVPSFSYISMDTANIYILSGGVTSATTYNTNIHYHIYYDL